MKLGLFPTQTALSFTKPTLHPRPLNSVVDSLKCIFFSPEILTRGSSSHIFLKLLTICLHLTYIFYWFSCTGTILSYFTKNNYISNPLQSAYRKHHSTESALLKVHNDIIISMDKGEVTALTLLDLSDAFDTIDHATITERLSELKTLFQMKSHSHLELHRALC